METKIKTVASMNDFNCSTSQRLNNSTSQQFNKLASHPLTNSSTHSLKTPIIQVKHLSKRYQIGMDRTYKTFCETAVDTIKSPLKRLKSFSRQEETFWALKDINLEVYPGEIVGIIGKNGAGKTTLLKILSRITHPTEGEVILRGRVGSLLEVGTGFHPELTGRENIYFNGAILGMSKTEIGDKFDDIVKFAEVEKFLDTPVKRYSSGMYVRLAFAVAAHMEPEILLVDEVLAVGDVAFQKRCMGKMKDVSKCGRTILFVSHNMGSIRQLCPKSMLLSAGRIEKIGTTDEIIKLYLGGEVGKDDVCQRNWHAKEAPGNEDVRIYSANLKNESGQTKTTYGTNEAIHVEITYRVYQDLPSLALGIYIHNQLGLHVCYSTDNDPIENLKKPKGAGYYTTICVIPGQFLNTGKYTLSIDCRIPYVKPICAIPNTLSFSVVAAGGPASVLGPRTSIVCPLLEWKTSKQEKNSYVHDK
jgi:lipopolysaccharide transport system ATP-binding protein